MSDGPGALTDVPIQGALLRRSRLFVLVAGVIALMIFAMFLVGGFGGAMTTTRMIIVIATGSAATLLVIQLQHRRTVRQSRQAVDDALYEPLEEIARAAIRRRDLSVGECVRAMVEVLAKSDRVGATFRICPKDAADPVEPTPYPFEPRPLEHAHVGHDVPGASAHGAQPEDSAPSTIRRNILLKGGWVLVVVFGFNVAISVITAITQRRLNQALFYWIAMLGFVLLVPVRAGRRRARTTECLLVPGGIIFRNSAWRSEKWDLHVFDRRASALCVHRLGKRQWMLAVADKDSSETALGTREEMHFLLRAWLSPLEPPTVEMLSDLT